MTSGPDGLLWFVERAGNKVGKISTSGTITEYSIPTGSSNPFDIVAGPDGLLWFTEEATNKIAKVTTSGSFTEYSFISGSSPKGLCVGPDGNLWVALGGSNKIAKVTTSGSVTEYSTQNSLSPINIAAGPDGLLWYTGTAMIGAVGKITTGGTITQYSVGIGASPWGITAGPDSSMWFTDTGTNKVNRITIGGTITGFTIPTGSSSPKDIVLGADNNLWFVESSAVQVGRVTPDGTFTEYTGLTSSSNPQFITLGGDNSIWWSETAGNKIGKLVGTVRGLVPTDDPSVLGPQFSVNTGNLHIEAPVALETRMTQIGAVLDPSNPSDWIRVVYNSQSTAYKPIVETVWYSDPNGSVPSPLEARLKWNSGSWGSWVSFGTTGHAAGDAYLLSLQVGSNVTATDRYSWEIEIKATFGSDTLTRNLTGYSLVVINDATASAYGHGWYVSGLDKIVSVTGGVMLLDGRGGARFYATLGTSGSTTSYLSPPNDLNSLSYDSSTTKYTYDARNFVDSTFDSGGKLTKIVDGNSFTTTYTYDSTRLSTIATPDGRVITFTYSSNRLSGVTAPNNALVTVTQDASNDLTALAFPDGSLRTFTYDASHKLTNEKWGSLNTTFAYDANNGTLATVTYSSTTSVTLSPRVEQGLTTSTALNADRARGVVTNPLGNVTTAAYDSFGQLTKLTTPDGAVTTLVRDTFGQVTKYIDPLGRVSSYAYDYTQNFFGTKNLSKTTYPDGTVEESIFQIQAPTSLVLIDPIGNRTTQGYDAFGNITSLKDPVGNVVTFTYSGGLLQSVKDVYDTMMNPNRGTYLYNANNRLETYIDPLGNRTTTAYDAYGNPNQVTNIYGKNTTVVYDAMHRPTTLIDVLNNRTTLAYNGQGQVTSQIDVLGNRTTSVYDNQARLETTIDVLGGRTTNVYDAAGQVTAVVDPLSYRTSFQYDTVGRLTEVRNPLSERTTLVYNLAGEVTAIVDPLGNRTSVLYDTYGRTETLIDALTNRTTIVYNSNGQVSATVNALGGRTTNVYDAKGRVEEVIDALGRRTTTVYDASYPRVSAAVDALAGRTTLLYDVRGRLEAIQNQLGNRFTSVYDTYGQVQATIDPLGNRTTTVFDAYGRAEATINPLGKRVTTVFDAYGRDSANVDQLGGRTTIVYDAYGRQQNLIDPVNNKTTFVYDALNRVVQEIDPLGKSTTMAYDAAGRLSSRTDRIGRRIDFAYDAAGRQTGEVWISWPSAIETNRLTFTYDAVGNLLTGRDYDGAYTMTYDALNRATTVHDVWGKRLTFTYDAVGNRTQVLDSAGGTTDSTFDSLNRLTNRKYTESGTVQLSVTQVYDAAGGTTEQWRYGTSYSLVARTSLTYDAANRLTNLQHRDGSSNNLANYTYTYDAESRLTTEVGNGTTVTYTYDDTDQLMADGTVTVTYDANGNRNNGSYTTGTGNRMTSDGTWTYTYNDEGNLTKKSKGASQETWIYGYDEKNQLLQVQRSQTDGGAVDRQVDFKYDVFGNRIEKSYDADGVGGGGATVTRFAYDAWKNTNQYLVGNENSDVWADLDGGSSLTTRYIRGDAIDEIFSRIDSGTNYWELTDRLGSVRDVINNSAVVKDTISYNGFGGITSETDSSFRGRYAWTGREIDTEINLQYNRARYYDTGTGHWISQDLLGFEAGDSNLYRYVRNAPTDHKDPTGYTDDEQLGSKDKKPYTYSYSFLGINGSLSFTPPTDPTTSLTAGTSVSSSIQFQTGPLTTIFPNLGIAAGVTNTTTATFGQIRNKTTVDIKLKDKTPIQITNVVTANNLGGNLLNSLTAQPSATLDLGMFGLPILASISYSIGSKKKGNLNWNVWSGDESEPIQLGIGSNLTDSDFHTNFAKDIMFGIKLNFGGPRDKKKK